MGQALIPALSKSWGGTPVGAWHWFLCSVLPPCLPSPEVAHLILQAVRLQQVHLGEASGGQVLDLL